jgi:hypothetical protein
LREMRARRRHDFAPLSREWREKEMRVEKDVSHLWRSGATHIVPSPGGLG